MENRVLPVPQRDTVLQPAVELPERSPSKSLLSKPVMPTALAADEKEESVDKK
jgi:hypothetical protein